MKHLVSGGFGFVGSYLVNRLLREGHSVHVVDNLSSNPIPLSVLLSEFDTFKNLTWDIRDIRDYTMAGFNAIWHFASPVGPAGVLKWAGNMAKQIVDDVHHMAYLARLSNCRLINIGTSESYGGGRQGLCQEDMDCVIQAKTTIRLEYAVSKLAAEIALRNTTELDHVTVRLFNVCGPRQAGVNGFVLPRFVNQALRGEKLTVFGDGTAVRAFTDVRDIADGLMLVWEKGRSGELFNLGNPKGKTTILDLAIQVNASTNRTPADIEFLDGRDIYGPFWTDAGDKFPDATKAIATLGWRPSYTISETIRDVIEYERGKVHVD